MNSRIDEEDEEEEEDDEGGDGDGEEGDGEEELSHQEDSDRISDDGLSHDRSLLTTGDESDASPPLPLPQHTGKRRNLLPSSPSSSSLGQGARVGLIGALGAMFSASAATTSRAQKRANKSKLTAEEILQNKLKVEQQLKLGIVICMHVCI
jgi:hypothetical protein